VISLFPKRLGRQKKWHIFITFSYNFCMFYMCLICEHILWNVLFIISSKNILLHLNDHPKLEMKYQTVFWNPLLCCLKEIQIPVSLLLFLNRKFHFPLLPSTAFGVQNPQLFAVYDSAEPAVSWWMAEALSTLSSICLVDCIEVRLLQSRTRYIIC